MIESTPPSRPCTGTFQSSCVPTSSLQQVSLKADTLETPYLSGGGEAKSGLIERFFQFLKQLCCCLWRRDVSEEGESTEATSSTLGSTQNKTASVPTAPKTAEDPLTEPQKQLLTKIRTAWDQNRLDRLSLQDHDFKILPLSKLTPEQFKAIFSADPFKEEAQEDQRRFNLVPIYEVSAAFRAGCFECPLSFLSGYKDTSHLVNCLTKEHLRGIKLADCTQEMIREIFRNVNEDDIELMAKQRERFSAFTPEDVALAHQKGLIEGNIYSLLEPKQLRALPLAELSEDTFRRIININPYGEVPDEYKAKFAEAFSDEQVEAALNNEKLRPYIYALMSPQHVAALKQPVTAELIGELIFPYFVGFEEQNAQRMEALKIHSYTQLEAVFQASGNVDGAFMYIDIFRTKTDD